MTLDGFAIRLIQKFPLRSGHNPQIFELQDRDNDYIAIRNAAVTLTQSGHLKDVLAATYARLLVDEYQDCNLQQHDMIAALSEVIPTCVLGDQMQAIFDLGGNNLVDWEWDVLPLFPEIGRLAVPRRWERLGMHELGSWLLEVREKLESGQDIDLREARGNVQWIRLEGHSRTHLEQRITAASKRPANRDGTVIIICDSEIAVSRTTISRRVFGSSVIERVDLPDLVELSRGFDIASEDAIDRFINFAGKLMTQVSAAQLCRRIRTILRNRSNSDPTAAEEAAVGLFRSRTWADAIHLLDTLSRQHRAQIYRPEMYRFLRRAMTLAAAGAHTLHEAVLSEREKYRHAGRPLSRRSVGSTLLVKGLEADLAVILWPEKMNAQHLYVAMTRGARQLVICSETPVLQPLTPR
jgi:DNA helicase-2/ATP-dependent DNA helicase PcrA